MSRTNVIMHEVTLEVMTCPVCQTVYGVNAATLDRARDDSSIWWYCTAGHNLHFPQEERKIKQQEKEIERLRRSLANSQESTRAAWAEVEMERVSHASTKGQLTKTRNRIKAGVCDQCHRQFPDLHDHMRSKHGTPEDAAKVAQEHGGGDMGSKAKSHWENWNLDRLRKEAHAKYGVKNVKKYKKAELIHEMRIAAQQQEK